MLHKYASQAKWEDAIRLCRFVKVSVFKFSTVFLKQLVAGDFPCFFYAYDWEPQLLWQKTKQWNYLEREFLDRYLFHFPCVFKN